MREAAQFVIVQQSAIYFTVFYFKAVKIFLKTKNKLRKYILDLVGKEWGKRSRMSIDAA